jgi:hypothetical protein
MIHGMAVFSEQYWLCDSKSIVPEKVRGYKRFGWCFVPLQTSSPGAGSQKHIPVDGINPYGVSMSSI